MQDRGDLVDPNYPTEMDLVRIERWEIREHGDLEKLFSFVRSLWAYPDYWTDGPWPVDRRPHFTEGSALHQVSTAGWPGNESLVGALRENWMAWSMTWVSSRRGGHHEFEVPRSKP